MSSALKREVISPKNSKSTARYHEEVKQVPNKRMKPNSTPAYDIPTLKRKNFVRACELVSQKAYFNYAERFQLIYMPVCMDRSSCMHASSKQSIIKEIPLKVTKLINIEMEASNWCGALEVCIMSITPTQYLSDVVLKDVVEIMLNAQEDLSSGYTISQVLDKCKLVLTLHFSTHCPCLHANIRKVYTNFLTSPMDNKEKTCTNRTQFGSEEGIVNFCLNRLEHELGADSSDSALLDKTAETPEEWRQTIKGLFYQKKQFGIFEMLDRAERIDRLMAVLHSIIELLQFDLAIWQSIRNSEKKKQLRGHKMLMACVLAPNNSVVTDICARILKIFSYFIHLEYPEEHIQTMTLWLNTVMEIFYMNHKYANVDYPCAGSSCKAAVKEFYGIISELPPKSIIKILERIKPAYLRHQISHDHANNLLSSDEGETLRILIDFLKNTKWKDLPRNESSLTVLEKLNVKRVKPNKLLKKLSAICNNPPIISSHNNNTFYPKFHPSPTSEDCEIDQSLIICTLYIALQSYLEAYGVQIIQETLHKLNEDLSQASTSEDILVSCNPLFESRSYAVTENFLKNYRHIFGMLKELILTIKEMESDTNSPEVLDVFKKIFD